MSMKPSDEATTEQLELGRAQGEAAVKALKTMMEKVATSGGEKRAGDYIVSYAIEEAEGMYHLSDGELQWQEPEEENLHVEVAVRDSDDGGDVLPMP